MIVITGTVPTRPDRRDDVIAAANEMRRATLEEPGCNAYRFSFATDDPALMCITEEWADQDSLTAHFTAPHMATFQAVLRDVVAGAGAFTKYEVSSSGPLF